MAGIRGYTRAGEVIDLSTHSNKSVWAREQVHPLVQGGVKVENPSYLA